MDCPLALLPTEVCQGVSEPSVSALKRTERAGKFVGGLCVALVAALYYTTLYPSLPGGDSGELIVASCSLGLPHPPGYPLFAMIGWLFTHIPYGSIAWRVNLFSAVCGVVAAALLYLAIFRVCLHTHYAFTRIGADVGSDASSNKLKNQLQKADEAHSLLASLLLTQWSCASFWQLNLSGNCLCGVREDDNGRQHGEYASEGIKAIADALRVNGGLKTLNLSINKIGGEGEASIRNAVQEKAGFELHL